MPPSLNLKQYFLLCVGTLNDLITLSSLSCLLSAVFSFPMTTEKREWQLVHAHSVLAFSGAPEFSGVVSLRVPISGDTVNLKGLCVMGPVLILCPL